jgi:hypothetical protein
MNLLPGDHWRSWLSTTTGDPGLQLLLIWTTGDLGYLQPLEILVFNYWPLDLLVIYNHWRSWPLIPATGSLGYLQPLEILAYSFRPLDLLVIHNHWRSWPLILATGSLGYLQPLEILAINFYLSYTIFCNHSY